MEPIVTEDQVSVFFDGVFTTPQLNHPEGIAVDPEGNFWCGGERGELFRIDRDGRSIEQIASTEGFTLGLAFDSDSHLYSCDLKLAAVFRLNTKTGERVRLADGDGKGRKLRHPNFPLVDQKNGYLYVSDSYGGQGAGPGIWRFDLATGKGTLWYDAPLHFANGLAMWGAEDQAALYVAESFGRRISRIPVMPDGKPGDKEVVVQMDDRTLPDGLGIDPLGRLYICCYEPSAVYRWSKAEGLELLYRDYDAHTLCHPTNCVFRGRDLFLANLGRWHITRIANVW